MVDFDDDVSEKSGPEALEELAARAYPTWGDYRTQSRVSQLHDKLREFIDEQQETIDNLEEAVILLRGHLARAPLTELCDEHADPWQEWYDRYKEVQEETEEPLSDEGAERVVNKILEADQTP